jgi:hypothetical protein
MEKFLYHGTSSTNLFSIYKKGLTPKCDINSFLNGQHKNMICLTSNKFKAKLYANRKVYELNKGKPVVLILKKPNQYNDYAIADNGTLTNIFYDIISKKYIKKIEQPKKIGFYRLLEKFNVK